MKNILVAIILLSAFNIFSQSGNTEIKKTVYPNGNRKSIGEYVNNVKHGTYQEFYESGSLWKDWYFVHGLEEGKSLWYFEDGTLSMEWNYVNGKL